MSLSTVTAAGEVPLSLMKVTVTCSFGACFSTSPSFAAFKSFKASATSSFVAASSLTTVFASFNFFANSVLLSSVYLLRSIPSHSRIRSFSSVLSAFSGASPSATMPFMAASNALVRSSALYPALIPFSFASRIHFFASLILTSRLSLPSCVYLPFIMAEAFSTLASKAEVS